MSRHPPSEASRRRTYVRWMCRLTLLLTAFFALTTPASAAWTWPASGDVITPYRNGADPYATGQHRGIDIAAPEGTPVVAAAGGAVRFAGTVGSSGLTVSVRTGDGYDTSYLHLSSLAVRAGGQVSAGDRIGAVGTTGTRSAPEPHLHFGVRDAGSRQAYHDPLAFLPPPAAPPAPDPPPPAPIPAPKPAPPAAVPSPARLNAPAARRSPRPFAVPRRLPRPVSRPHRGARPLTAPERAPRSFAAPHGVPRPVTAPHGIPRPVTGRRGAPAPDGTPRAVTPTRPLAGPRRAPAPIAAPRRPRPAARQARAARADSERGAGLDMWWAIACGGLLLAAAVLAPTEGRTGGKRALAGRLGRLRALALRR